MGRQAVLIVDDEAIVRESLEDWLKGQGYEVATAQDGEEALRMFGGQDFGVLVLDWKLPGKDGIEVLKMARAEKPWVQGIVITAYPSKEIVVQATEAGAMGYLPKPFTPDVLERLIEQGFQSRGKQISAEAVIEKKETKTAIAEPETTAAVAKEVAKPKEKECVWMKLGVVSYRLCTRNYDCLGCDFDQSMQSGAGQEAAGASDAIERLKELPGYRRLCRYALKGEVSYRLCSRLYQCAICPFDQLMQDLLDQKLAKLAARREALHKKAEKESKTPAFRVG